MRPNIRMADRFGVGHVFVIGDSAHAHPPMRGQGLNMSVQDAVSFFHDRLLQDYEQTLIAFFSTTSLGLEARSRFYGPR